MANDVATNDPLAWLVQALEPELAKVEASAEYNYSSSERGSLSINRAGKASGHKRAGDKHSQNCHDGHTSVWSWSHRSRACFATGRWGRPLVCSFASAPA